MVEGAPPAPCVGCGYCCIKTPCSAALRLYPGVTECPELKWDGSRYQCGLMLKPGGIGQRYREELYAGAGCCCSLNSWRKDVKQRMKKEEKYLLNPLTPEFQIFLRCLSKEFISGDVIYLTIEHFKAELEKRNYTPDQIQSYVNNIVNIFTNNKSAFMSEFIG